jgi:hypothetical protein
MCNDGSAGQNFQFQKVEYNLDDATVEDESPDERDAKGQT